MAPGGLTFNPIDGSGNPTTNPAAVVRISLMVTGRTMAPLSVTSSYREWAIGDLTTEITLRNNPRF